MAVFPAHKSAVDDDIFSIGEIDYWLNGATLDVAGSSISVVDINGDPVAGMYTAGSLAYNPATGVITFRMHGGTAGQIYTVLIDLATTSPSLRTKRYRMALTVVD